MSCSYTRHKITFTLPVSIQNWLIEQFVPLQYAITLWCWRWLPAHLEGLWRQTSTADVIRSHTGHWKKNICSGFEKLWQVLVAKLEVQFTLQVRLKNEIILITITAAYNFQALNSQKINTFLYFFWEICAVSSEHKNCNQLIYNYIYVFKPF